MELKKNTKLQERRYFLKRALQNRNITVEEYHKEISGIDKKIKENLIEALLEAKEQMKTEVQEIKETVSYDGDLKRGVANVLIRILKTQLEDDEIKGCFRQGYKIMRGM